MTTATLPLVSEVRFGVARAVDWLFEGRVKGSVYTVLRVGTAAIFLVRHADWLRPWFFLEHHRFVRGLMFLDPSPAEPRLLSPMIAGFSLGDGATRALVLARTALSILLLFGVRARLSAGLLAAVSYTLLLADQYRYYHHLHLLYVTLAFLALAPIGRNRAAVEPLWPLQLVRALVIGVYAAAGVSKLSEGFLAGDALRALERFHVLKGPVWELVGGLAGYAVVAKLSLLTELFLPIGLMLRRTRRFAIFVGLLFHAGISASMPVYSFGAQMAVLLFAFWPDSEPGTVSSTDRKTPDTRRT
jgi:hypothetical protein